MNIQPSMPLSEMSSNGSKNWQLPTVLINQLTSATTEREILQVGVEIAHRTLNCDRVVVYSMESLSRCKIVAESLTPGYTPILDLTIEDPCFEARYIDKYQRGRVRAITNIHEAGMSTCYIENLAKIDVKSNLVVPLIAPDKNLYGLLVAHQCSGTRKWLQNEIEFALSIANWTMKQVFEQKSRIELETQLSSQKNSQKLLTEIVREIHGADTSEQVLQIAADKTKELLNCDRVVVYGLQSGNMGEIVAEATVPALASILARVIKDPCFEYRYLESYQQGRVRAIDDIYNAGMTPCYIDNLAKIGVKSNLVAPINWDNGKIYGLLVAHQCFSFKNWQNIEIENCRQLAIHTGLALSKTRLKQESQLVEMGLTKLNDIQTNFDEVRAKIEQFDRPIQQSSRMLVEANNLNKLLAREINAIAQNSSSQTKKNLKLLSIIAKKLAVVSSKLRESLGSLESDRQEAKNILLRAINYFDNKSS